MGFTLSHHRTQLETLIHLAPGKEVIVFTIDGRNFGTVQRGGTGASNEQDHDEAIRRAHELAKEEPDRFHELLGQLSPPDSTET